MAAAPHASSPPLREVSRRHPSGWLSSGFPPGRPRQNTRNRHMWVVVKIMVPFRVLSMMRHLVFRGPKRGPYDNHTCGLVSGKQQRIYGSGEEVAGEFDSNPFIRGMRPRPPETDSFRKLQEL